ncbi:MAG TPA: sigma 54-interacting transcriptional regulator [Polyangiaceae bacterium]
MGARRLLLRDEEQFGNPANYLNPGMQARKGRIGTAHGGTFFLDEIGDCPLDAQAQLLRVMDAGEYEGVGEATVRRVDLRFLGATNRDESSFRPDFRAAVQRSLRRRAPAASAAAQRARAARGFARRGCSRCPQPGRRRRVPRTRRMERRPRRAPPRQESQCAHPADEELRDRARTGEVRAVPLARATADCAAHSPSGALTLAPASAPHGHRRGP